MWPQNLHTQYMESWVDKRSVDCIDVIQQTVTIPKNQSFLAGNNYNIIYNGYTNRLLKGLQLWARHENLDIVLSSDLFIIS